MTKGAALQQFFGQFMTAYASNAVPDGRSPQGERG